MTQPIPYGVASTASTVNGEPNPFVIYLFDLPAIISAETASRLFLRRVQLVECAFQCFKLLSSLAKFAFRGQPLVVGKIFGGFRDERAAILCGLGRRGGCGCASRRLWRGAQRRHSCAKKSRHRRFEGWSVGQPILQ